MAHLTLNDLKVYNASATERFLLEEYGIECFAEVTHRSRKNKDENHHAMVKIFKIQFIKPNDLKKFVTSLVGVVDFSVTGNEVRIKVIK